jgi:hypothetical protein
MKKVSTAASEQSRNFSDQKLTIGLDLRDRNSWYCILDEAGRYSWKAIYTSLRPLFAEPKHPELRLESTLAEFPTSLLRFLSRLPVSRESS